MSKRQVEALERIATALEVLIEWKTGRPMSSEARLDSQELAQLERWESARRLERRLQAYRSASEKSA